MALLFKFARLDDCNLVSASNRDRLQAVSNGRGLHERNEARMRGVRQLFPANDFRRLESPTLSSSKREPRRLKSVLTGKVRGETEHG